tara:strand:- start:618 stop:1070 length:453 start_codon:yes stop_codon:yes gene_type:complete
MNSKKIDSNTYFKNFIVVILIFIFLFLLYYLVSKRIYELYSENDPIIIRIKKNLMKLDSSAEKIRIYESNKSYTINKKIIYICIKNKNNQYYDFNMLMYVAIHELAHVLCDEIGHTEKFYSIFNNLLDKAENLNMYNSTIPIISNYCEHN